MPPDPSLRRKGAHENCVGTTCSLTHCASASWWSYAFAPQSIRYHCRMSDTASPLRILHTSDWHIGHDLHGHSREVEHDAFLGWLIEELCSREVDALLITGDIFDVANPPVAATRRFYAFLRDATARCSNLSIVVIGGNHDSAARISLPAALLGDGRVHLIGQLPRCDGSLDFNRLLVELPNKIGEPAALVAAVPYCRPGDLGQRDLASLYAEVLEAAVASGGGLPLIVTGHLHVAGGDMSPESERRIVIGGEEAQAATLFDERAAYVALGHLHRPQKIAGSCLIRYAGSPFPMSAAEREYRHSIVLVEFAAEGVKAEEIPIPRTADFLTVPSVEPLPIADVEQLLRELQVEADLPLGRMPFLEVSVLLDRPEPGITARVREALDGKPVRLTRVRPVYPSGAADRSIAARSQALDELQPADVFSELHTARHGSAPDAALAEAFARLLIEVEQDQAE